MNLLRNKLLIIFVGFVASVQIAISAPSKSEIDAILQETPRKIEGTDFGRVSDRFSARLAKAQKLMGQERYDQAMRLLAKLEQSAGENKFAKSQVYQTRAFIYAQQDKTSEAIADFKKVTELDAMPKIALLNTYYAVSQLLASQEKYLESIKYLKVYLENKKPPTAEALFFYSQLLGQIDRKELALKNAEAAVKLSKGVKKSWLNYLVALYYQTERFSETEVTLKKLIELEPSNAKYWRQLASVYLVTDRPDEALATLESAKINGVLKKSGEHLRLARMALNNGVPYKAALYIESATKKKIIKADKKSLKLLGDCYLSARENSKAIRVYSVAAELSDSADLFLKLGQLHLKNEDWKKAYKNLKKANKNLKSLSKRKQGSTLTSSGIASFRLGNKDEALDFFEQAKEFKSQKAIASEWIRFLAISDQTSP